MTPEQVEWAAWAWAFKRMGQRQIAELLIGRPAISMVCTEIGLFCWGKGYSGHDRKEFLRTYFEGRPDPTQPPMTISKRKYPPILGTRVANVLEFAGISFADAGKMDKRELLKIPNLGLVSVQFILSQAPKPEEPDLGDLWVAG